MAGIALVLDLLNKNPSILLRSTLHSHGFFSAKAAVFSAASSAVVAAPFAAWGFLGKGRPRIGHCDAGVAPIEDYSSTIVKTTLQKDVVYHGTKEYRIELKPFWSNFDLKTLGWKSLRFFLLSLLNLLKTYQDEDNFEQDSSVNQLVNLALIRTSKQIFLKEIATTVRRALEIFVIHNFSRHTAWKFLKDASESAARKAARKMPTYIYIYCVSKTTLRVHCLGVLTTWMVEVGMDVYWYCIRMWNFQDESNGYDRRQLAQILGWRVYVTTVRSYLSLILAPVGAGIGAVIGAAMFRPSTGQWIGCAVGDVAGNVIVQLVLLQI